MKPLKCSKLCVIINIITYHYSFYSLIAELLEQSLSPVIRNIVSKQKEITHYKKER